MLDEIDEAVMVTRVSPSTLDRPSDVERAGSGHVDDGVRGIDSAKAPGATVQPDGGTRSGTVDANGVDRTSLW